MSDLWQRYGEKELTRADHDRLFWYVFSPYAAMSLIGVACIDFELGPVSDSMMEWAVKVFFLPCFLVVRVIQSHTPPLKSSFPQKIVRWILACVIALFAAGAGFGYVNVCNALMGSTQVSEVRGPVVAVEKYSGHWAGVRRIVTIDYGGRNVRLSVNSAEFSQLQVGSVYGREMRLGGLGYYYRWGLGFWK